MIGTWRQNQARQSYWDEAGATGKFSREGLEAVIEIATTVKITQDALDELIHSVPPTALAGDDEVRTAMHEGAVAFLTTLGFEIVQ